MHHTCTCIFKGPLDTSCSIKKTFPFLLFYYSWIIFYQAVKDLFFFFIQYLLHIHRTVLCKSSYCIHVHVFKKHNTCICITLHSSMLTGNGSHQHSLSEMGNKNLVIKYERENDWTKSFDWKYELINTRCWNENS